MMKVYGGYTNSDEASKAVDELLIQGYSKDEIKVISNIDDLDSNEKGILDEYKTKFQSGQIIVLVEEGSSAYRDHFRDGVPDWDEREEEFNEDSDGSIEVRGNRLPAKKSTSVNDNFSSGINLDKGKFKRDNLNLDERENIE